MSPRVTVVIGGTSGIGRAAAEQVAPKGDTIVLVAREGGAFDEAVRAVKTAGARDVRSIAADVGLSSSAVSASPGFLDEATTARNARCALSAFSTRAA